MAILKSKKDKSSKDGKKKSISFRDRLSSNKSNTNSRSNDLATWAASSVVDLSKNVEDIKKELQELRFQVAVGTIPNVRRIRALKKNVARILTIKRSKELSLSSGLGN